MFNTECSSYTGNGTNSLQAYIVKCMCYYNVHARPFEMQQQYATNIQ